MTRARRGAQDLVDFLREDLGLTGSHVGCEHGVCGACTVRVNGEIVRGCLMLAVQCDGAKVETIEGLSDTGEIADLQDAFEKRNALQCGYLHAGHADDRAGAARSTARTPSRDEIREHLSGNYCRCTGYHAIVDAVEAVAQARAERNDMKIVADLPLAADRARPAELLYRPLGAAAEPAAADAGPRRNMSATSTLPRMVHVAFLRSPHAHARIVTIDAPSREEGAGRDRGRHRRRNSPRSSRPGSACSRI